MEAIVINNRDYNLIFNQDSFIKGVYEILEAITIPYGTDISLDNNNVIVISKNGRSISINENELYPANSENLEKLEFVIEEVINFCIKNSDSIISFDIDGINFVIKAYENNKGYNDYIMLSELKEIEGIRNIARYLMKLLGKYVSLDYEFLEKTPAEMTTKLRYLELMIKEYIDQNNKIKEIYLPLP